MKKLERILNFLKKIELLTSDNEITEKNKGAALAQYDQLSNDWRHQAGDIWKYLFAIFVIHGVFYSENSLYSSLYIQLLLTAVTFFMFHAALKSDAYARRIEAMKREIERHPVIQMPFIGKSLDPKWEKIFFRKSAIFFSSIMVAALFIYDVYRVIRILIDP